MKRLSWSVMLVAVMLMIAKRSCRPPSMIKVPFLCRSVKSSGVLSVMTSRPLRVSTLGLFLLRRRINLGKM